MIGRRGLLDASLVMLLAGVLDTLIGQSKEISLSGDLRPGCYWSQDVCLNIVSQIEM